MLYCNHFQVPTLPGQGEKAAAGELYTSHLRCACTRRSISPDGHRLSCCWACLSHHSLLKQNTRTSKTAEGSKCMCIHNLCMRSGAAAGAEREALHCPCMCIANWARVVGVAKRPAVKLTAGYCYRDRAGVLPVHCACCATPSTAAKHQQCPAKAPSQ